MVASPRVGHISGAADSLRDRFLRRNEVVAGGAVLSACDRRARSWRRECFQRGEVRERVCSPASSRRKASAVAGGDACWLSSVIARLHGAEPARLFAVLHFRQAGLDSADGARVCDLLLPWQTGLADRGCSHVFCTALPALRLLQRRERVVDRSRRSEPALLRLGFCSERDRRERSGKKWPDVGINSHLRRNYPGGNWFFHRAPLLSFSVVIQWIYLSFIVGLPKNIVVGGRWRHRATTEHWPPPPTKLFELRGRLRSRLAC